MNDTTARTWGKRTAAVGILASLLLLTAWELRASTGTAAGAGERSHAGVLIASAATYPDGYLGKKVAVLTTRTRSLNRTWNQFELPGSPPTVNFENHFVLFAGKGISGSCPEEFRYLDRIEGEKLVKVELRTAWGPVCTDDWKAHTFVVGAGRDLFPRGEFEVRIGSGKTVTVDRR